MEDAIADVKAAKPLAECAASALGLGTKQIPAISGLGCHLIPTMPIRLRH